jgi:hypothetical protein
VECRITIGSEGKPKLGKWKAGKPHFPNKAAFDVIPASVGWFDSKFVRFRADVNLEHD